MQMWREFEAPGATEEEVEEDDDVIDRGGMKVAARSKAVGIFCAAGERIGGC